MRYKGKSNGMEDITSYDNTPFHMMSYNIHIIPYDIISYHIISYHIISHHIISNQIKSNHIISYHITGFKNPLNMMTITPLNKHSTNLHELNKIFLWPAKTIFSANFRSEKYGKKVNKRKREKWLNGGWNISLYERILWEV